MHHSTIKQIIQCYQKLDLERSFTLRNRFGPSNCASDQQTAEEKQKSQSLTY